MKAITFRLPEQELEILQTYCEQEGRNQTDVLREYIRSLKRELNVKTKINWESPYLRLPLLFPYDQTLRGLWSQYLGGF